MIKLSRSKMTVIAYGDPGRDEPCPYVVADLQLYPACYTISYASAAFRIALKPFLTSLL
jgi:hypothetical protein